MSDDENKEGADLRIVDFAPVDKNAATLEEMRRKMPMLLDSIELMVQLRRASYEAHVRAGFTPEEALQLCWRMGG